MESKEVTRRRRRWDFFSNIQGNQAHMLAKEKKYVPEGEWHNVRDNKLTSFGIRSLKPMTLVLGIIVLGILFDVMYLLIESIRFEHPCRVAASAKSKLEQSPRELFTASSSQKLPKIIHQQWKNNQIPKGIFSKYHAAWKSIFPEPEYVHMLWSDKSGRALIQEHFSWFLDAYDSYPTSIQRADSVRYFILYKYGGVYADLDYEPYVNFWGDLPSDRVGIVESPYKKNEEVQNSLMSSPPFDPFWNVTFSLLYERRKDPRILSSTGPSLIEGAINAAPHRSWVHILPCQNFHRIPLGDAGIHTPIIGRISRAVMSYSPLVKTCGNWAKRDDCHFGLHHNAISYQENLADSVKSFFNNL
jgi:inositol phosphorylceramide mannosyltransferase catalytic subunit